MPMISEANPVAFADPLPDEVEVLVIGAGVVGVSTAYFLAKSGVRVAVCEKGAGRRRAVEPELGMGAAAGAGPGGAPHRHGVEPDLAGGSPRRPGNANLAFTECGCLYLATRSRTECPAGRSGAIWRRATSSNHASSPRSRPRALVPDLAGRWSGGIFTPSDGRGRALRRGAGARPRGPPARRGRRRELRGAYGGGRRRGGSPRSIPSGGRTAVQGRWCSREGRGARSSPRTSASICRSSRSRATVGRTHTGERRREPRGVLPRALPPAPGGRGVHGRGRRPHRALRRTALVPLPREVPGPPRSECEEPSGPRRSAAGISGKLGGATAAGPRTRSPRSRGRGC